MRNFLKKIYFSEINLVIVSTYLSLFLINFFITQKKLNEENRTIINNLAKAKENYEQFKLKKTFFPYLIINNETDKFDQLIQDHKVIPISTISNKYISLCNESGNPVSFFSDKFGFRNNNSVYSENSEKIIFIGDSFIIGFCHNDNDIIASIVDNALDSKRVLNLSHGGTGPLIQSAIIREYTQSVNFNEIYWFLFTGNDFINMEQEFQNVYLKKYVNQNYSQNLNVRQNNVDNIYLQIAADYIKLEDDFIQRYKKKKIDLINLLKLTEIKKILIKRTSNRIDKDIIDKYLKLIIDTKINHLKDKKLNIVILPEERTFKLQNFESYYRVNYIKKVLRKNNINVLDLSKRYKNKYKFLDLYYSRYTHYNKNAQSIIAQDLINFIKKNN
jgi:hypothetical protein